MVFKNKRVVGSFRAFTRSPFWIGVTVIVSFGSGVIFNQYFSQIPNAYQETNSFSPSWKVCFTPTSRCLPFILAAIKEAKKSVRVQGYSITSPEIGAALRDAHRKGLKVIVIADKTQKTAQYSQINSFLEAGIPVFIDAQPAIAHNKIIIVDQSIVLTGSYNWTKSAELRNAENLLLIRDKELIRQYEDNFQRRLLKSKRHSPVSSNTSK